MYGLFWCDDIINKKFNILVLQVYSQLNSLKREENYIIGFGAAVKHAKISIRFGSYKTRALLCWQLSTSNSNLDVKNSLEKYISFTVFKCISLCLGGILNFVLKFTPYLEYQIIVKHGLMNWQKLPYHMTKETALNFNFPGSYPCDLEAHRLHRRETPHYGLALSLLTRLWCTYRTGNPSPSTPWSWTYGPEAFFGAIGVVNSTPKVLYYLILSTVTFARPGI